MAPLAAQAAPHSPPLGGMRVRVPPLPPVGTGVQQLHPQPFPFAAPRGIVSHAPRIDAGLPQNYLPAQVHANDMTHLPLTAKVPHGSPVGHHAPEDSGGGCGSLAPDPARNHTPAPGWVHSRRRGQRPEAFACSQCLVFNLNADGSGLCANCGGHTKEFVMAEHRRTRSRSRSRERQHSRSRERLHSRSRERQSSRSRERQGSRSRERQRNRSREKHGDTER